MAEALRDGTLARVATRVNAVLSGRYEQLGRVVGAWPGLTCGLSLVVVALCASGFSQLQAETEPAKLWIPQGTRAQQEEKNYTAFFPPSPRRALLLLEAKTGSSLDKSFLEEALSLHLDIENLSVDGKGLRDICVLQEGDGHKCDVSSVLGAWGYEQTALSAEASTDTCRRTLNHQGKSREDFRLMLGAARFRHGRLLSAISMTIAYSLRQFGDGAAGADDHRTVLAWEEAFLDHLKCDQPSCNYAGSCACGYNSSQFSVYALAARSWEDQVSGVANEMSVVDSACVMLLYLILTLGGVCHKLKSKTLLALSCMLIIFFAAVSGYGLAMWLQFPYTPVHRVLPFVFIGIGVDSSFVIVHALDREAPDQQTPSKEVKERIASALKVAGVSVMVTSLTDFVAFIICVSSSLPAISSFGAYAAFGILMLFVFQVTMFTAMAALDLRRMEDNRMDVFCLKGGCPCCPLVPLEEANEVIRNGGQDPNQLCCCVHPEDEGGRVGRVGHFTRHGLGFCLVKFPVSLAVVCVFLLISGCCLWLASQLRVQDTARQFIPDDSYMFSTLQQQDFYFGGLPVPLNIMTLRGDYFASQQALASISSRLGQIKYVVSPSTTPDSFHSWAEAFKLDCISGKTGVPHENGTVTDRSKYYQGLKAWLSGLGSHYSEDVIWVDEHEPTRGISATRILAKLYSRMEKIQGRFYPDADFAVNTMSSIRDACDGWADLPGGGAVPYAGAFLAWEMFGVIRWELYHSVGLCLVAVFVITMVFIGHPLTAALVFLCVLLTIVDILGCMQLLGLSIDNITVVQLVLAVGLSVDYAAHVGHSFMILPGSREDRVLHTLGDVGAAVLKGAVSTVLGVMPLAFSNVYMFRVLFQCFLLTSVIGSIHGLVLLPAMLRLVGPAPYLARSKSRDAEVKYQPLSTF